MGGYSKKKNLLITVIAIIICGLLVFSNGIAYGLFAIPVFAIDIVALGTLTVAVALSIVFGILVIGEKPKGALSKTQKAPVINAAKEANETPTTTAQPVNRLIWVDQQDQEIKQLIMNSTRKPVSQTVSEPKNVKELKIRPVKLICPACRKEFSMLSSIEDYIIDFGPPKKSNLLKDCPHCHTSISLKRTELQEDLWENTSS